MPLKIKKIVLEYLKSAVKNIKSVDPTITMQDLVGGFNCDVENIANILKAPDKK